MWPVFLQRMVYSYQEKQEKIRKARAGIGGLLGTDHVVEVGCGFGANSSYCKGPYLGTDIRPDAIREAKRYHPDKHFLCCDVQKHTRLYSACHTVLFSAVLHELPDYKDMINSVMQDHISRILICDYDPELGGWLKIWMDIFEPHSKNWWGCKPAQLFPETGWTVTSGQITPSFLYWDAKRISAGLKP